MHSGRMRSLAFSLLTLGTLTAGTLTAAHAQAGGGRSADSDSLAARIAAAAALPNLAEEIRGAGVSRQDLAAVLAVLGERNVPATDARRILEEEWDAAREHGPVPGLGLFVRGRLDEGLRGRALADAIRREHARRGTGGDGVERGTRRESAARGETGARGEPGKRDESGERGKAPPSPAEKNRGGREDPPQPAEPR